MFIFMQLLQGFLTFWSGDRLILEVLARSLKFGLQKRPNLGV